MLKRSSIYHTLACLASGDREGPASKGLKKGTKTGSIHFHGSILLSHAQFVKSWENSSQLSKIIKIRNVCLSHSWWPPYCFLHVTRRHLCVDALCVIHREGV